MLVAGSPITVLTELPRWVAWRNEERKNKLAKIPYTPGTDRWAATDKPETWASYEAAAGMKGCDGPGFVLTGLPELAAIDLDRCRDAQSGRIEPWAVAICERAQSYTELSPSGRGVHVLGLAPGLPPTTVTLPQGDGGQQCEVYCGGTVRYLTVSWEQLEEYPGELNDIGPLVRELIDQAAPRQAAATGQSRPKTNGAAGVLAALPNDYARAGWVRLAMAHKAAGGSFDAFDAWSRQHPSYDADETARVWQSLAPRGEVANATLAFEARRHGIEVPPADELPPRPPIVATPFVYRDPRKLPRRDPLYAAHYHRGYVSATLGAGGTGKSSLQIAEAIDMASKRGLFHPVRRVLRVWYWNLEDPEDEIDRRIAAALAFHNIGPADIGNRLFRDSGRTTPLQIAAFRKGGVAIAHDQVAEVLETIEVNSIDVLMIDPIISAHAVSENDNVAMTAVVDRLRHIAHVGKVALDFSHHLRKANGLNAEPSADDARGGSAIISACRSARLVTIMTREEAEAAQIEPDRRRFIFGSTTSRATWRRRRSLPPGAAS